MPTKAELRARLTLNKSLFDAGIAAAQGGARQLGAGLAAASRIGSRAMLFAGTAAIGLGTGIAYGTKRAFDLGSTLKDLSSRTGILPGKLVVLQRAFKDAGLEAEDVGLFVNRMQKFIQEAGDKGLKKFGLTVEELKRLKPDEQFEAIGKAINAIKDPAEKTAAAMKIFGRSGGKVLQIFGDPKAMTDAAAAVGKQAEILNKNAGLFDTISDKLSHAGTKLQGFFVGVAGGMANALLPILNKLDTIDLSGVGQKFGQSLVTGMQAFIGLLHNPSLLFDTATAYFRASILGIGNVLIAVFKTSIEFFKDGFLQAITGAGSAIVATLIEAFSKPIAFFQAGIEKAMESAMPGGGIEKSMEKFNIEANTKLRDAIGFGRTNTGELTGLGKSAQAQIDKSMARLAEMEKNRGKSQSVAERAGEILKEGVKVGLGEGMTADEWRKQAREQFNIGLDKATAAAKKFKIEDILGAGPAMTAAQAKTRVAAAQGRELIGELTAPPPAIKKVWDRFAGFSSNLGELSKHMMPPESAFGFGGAGGADVDLAGMGQAYKTSPYAYKTHPEAYDQTGPQPAAEQPEMEQPITSDQMRNIMQEAGWLD